MLPKLLHDYFYLSQIGIGALFLGVAWIFFRPKPPESNFRVREADREPAKRSASAIGPQDLANAKMKRNEPLRLGGIRIDGTPHEILGVCPGAKPEDIQKAYRERMKQYHPDKIGQPGSREWQDAQKIAEAINRAKEALLKSAK
jgi:DnaJ-domain-containing protein 1